MPADFATNADALAAGWARSKGPGPGGYGWMTIYEMHLSQDRQSGHAMRITAYSAVSGGAADKQALDALNGYRRLRYGADGVGPASRGPRSGQILIPDQT